MPHWCMREAWSEGRPDVGSQAVWPTPPISMGLGVAIVLALPQPRAREPSGCPREFASGDPAEEIRQERADPLREVGRQVQRAKLDMEARGSILVLGASLADGGGGRAQGPRGDVADSGRPRLACPHWCLGACAP